MDDGFQHFRLYRDLDLVCADAMRPLWDEACLPAGTLREPVEGLRRAGVVFLTKSNFISEERLRRWRAFLAAAAPGVPVVPVRYELAGGFRGRRVLALSGLARPESFEEGLRRAGADVASLRCPDHHVFTASEREEALRRARAEERSVVVTEKDRARLPADFPCETVRLEWVPEESPEWLEKIESAIS
jgi:tetraacyldisaccharide 4'-kinase